MFLHILTERCYCECYQQLATIILDAGYMNITCLEVALTLHCFFKAREKDTMPLNDMWRPACLPNPF